MATNIKLKSSALAGKVPALSDISLRELAVNTADGKLFLRRGDGSSSDKIVEVTAPLQANEPMGHEDRTQSLISFDSSTRTFTIQPTSTSFNVWCKGIKYTFSEPQTVTIPDSTGLYYIYFDVDGVLSYKTTYFTWDLDTPTAYIYWNSNISDSPFIADERHGIALDWATHEYLHRTRGAAISDGFDLSNYSITGDGTSNEDVTVDLENGTFFDEDLEINVTHSNSPITATFTQVLKNSAKIPIFYQNGSGGSWVKDGSTIYPVKFNSTERIRYNILSGGSWTTTEVADEKYTITWVIATNDIFTPILGLLDQSQYETSSDAEAALFTDLSLQNFPIFEFRPLWKLIYKTSDQYTNNPKSKLVQVIDLRQISASIPGNIVYDHGLLTGLTDDDHEQYVHTSIDRVISANHEITGNLTLSGGLKDGQSSLGLAGQHLISTSTGVEWRFSSTTNVLYVNKDGDDNNTGTSEDNAKATIKSALSSASEGTIIKVDAGSYVEDNPLIIPEQVSIVGSSLREVSVTPQNQGDLFYVSNGNYISDMSFVGPYNTGAIFAFNPNNPPYISQSPYIQNCTNFIPGSIGMKIDGDVSLGKFKSMVVDSYTQYNQGGIGAYITNDAYAQLVSMFTICCDTAIKCENGGGCDLTNSNSSFGNYGLVSRNVSPLKYSGAVVDPVGEGGSIIRLDFSTPTLNVTQATYDNQTGLLTAYTDNPHNFSVGMDVTINDLQFSCPDGPEILTYPTGNYGYDFKIRTVAPGRYVDASNLILSNKQEIQDKSLAAIALNHPDFVFPNDSSSDLRYRYYDSYRLIQQNKTEIINTAFTTAVNDPLFTGFDFSSVETKCKRDLGYFIDAISTDIFTGGNNYSIKFVEFYFNSLGDPISNGLVGEESESVYVFNQAASLMKQAITNQLTIKDLTLTADPITGDNQDPTSCANVQTTIDNLTTIVTQTITDGNLNLVNSLTINIGSFTDGASKCRRDIGYIVDAVAKDLESYTNKNIIESTKLYFNKSGQPISNGLVGEEAESITAFTAVRDYCKKAINNLLNYQDLTLQDDPLTNSNQDENSCSDVKTTIDNLISILTTTIAAGNLDNLPQISMSSNLFTAYVGSSTKQHTYVSGGTVKNKIIRPFDGQALYIDNLYYSVIEVEIVNPGSGYISNPIVTVEAPDESWGIKAIIIPELVNGSIDSVSVISSGRGYSIVPPKITISAPPEGGTQAVLVAKLTPEYYLVQSSKELGGNVYDVELKTNLEYNLIGSEKVYFFKQSRLLASGHCFEYIGSGTDINSSLPQSEGVAIEENETVSENGGIVVYTSTNHTGNFRIGDGVLINQATSSVSGDAYTRSLFATITPFVLALGG